MGSSHGATEAAESAAIRECHARNTEDSCHLSGYMHRLPLIMTNDSRRRSRLIVRWTDSQRWQNLTQAFPQCPLRGSRIVYNP